MLLYVLPALLVLIGLRRQHPAAVGVLTAALATVGVTMYDHGPLAVHLAAIFTSAVLLTAILALLTRSPHDRSRALDTGPDPSEETRNG